MRIPSGYSQVNLRLEGAALPTYAEMTFGVDHASDTDAQELAVIVRDQLIANDVFDVIVNDVAVVNIHVKQGPNETGNFADLPVNLVGLVTSPPVPGMVSALITKQTARGGRAGRGRMYLPGLSEAQVLDGGAIDEANRDAIEDVWEAFRVDMDTAGQTLVLLHNGNEEPDDITGLRVSVQTATQRRRNRR